MLRKIVAASVITIWFTLFAIESSEDAGLFKYSLPWMNNAVESTVASFGRAIPQSSHAAISSPLSVQRQIFDASVDHLSLSRLSTVLYLRKEAEFLKGHLKIHKVHRVFLI
jgi:hypothetical protein